MTPTMLECPGYSWPWVARTGLQLNGYLSSTKSGR